MAEQAIKETNATATASWAPKVVGTNEIQPDRAHAPAFGTADIAQPPRPLPLNRDWSSALDLIREATDAIAISEQRAADLEFTLKQVAENASEEVRQLDAKIVAADRRAQKAEERARAAEARATEAETWLARIHDAVLTGFRQRVAPSRSEQSQPGAPGPSGPAEQDEPVF